MSINIIRRATHDVLAILNLAMKIKEEVNIPLVSKSMEHLHNYGYISNYVTRTDGIITWHGITTLDENHTLSPYSVAIVGVAEDDHDLANILTGKDRSLEKTWGAAYGHLNAIAIRTAKFGTQFEHARYLIHEACHARFRYMKKNGVQDGYLPETYSLEEAVIHSTDGDIWKHFGGIEYANILDEGVKMVEQYLPMRTPGTQPFYHMIPSSKWMSDISMFLGNPTCPKNHYSRMGFLINYINFAFYDRNFEPSEARRTKALVLEERGFVEGEEAKQ